MPKDFKTGNCYCDSCGEFYGNLYKDGMGMRSRKYCKTCSAAKKREQDRLYQQGKRRTMRELKTLMRKERSETASYVQALEKELGIRQKRLDEIHKQTANEIVYAKCGRCGAIQDRSNKYCSECGAKFVKT